MAYSPSLWLMAIGWWNKINQCRKLKLNLTQTWGLYESWFRNALISKSVILWWQVKKGINSELEGASKHTQSLKHSFKKVSVSHAQLAHFSTLTKEKHMLLILNFSKLTFITNARTTMGAWNSLVLCKLVLITKASTWMFENKVNRKHTNYQKRNWKSLDAANVSTFDNPS